MKSRHDDNPPPQRASVVVVGAGAAGMSAAIGAARAGAEVQLIERTEALGGTVANTLIHTLGGLYDDRQQPLNGGLATELADRLFRASSQTRLRRIGKVYCLSVCPQVYRQVVENWVAEETRIRPIFGANFEQLTMDGNTLVQCEVVRGGETMTFRPTAVVDASGTAEVVRKIDARNIDDDEGRAAGGLIFRLRGVQPGSVSFPNGVALVQQLRDAARHAKLPASCEHAWLDQGVYDDEVYVKLFVPLDDNWRRPGRLEQLTREMLEIQGSVVDFMRRWSGFGDARIAETGQLGVRDGGRIRGEYYLTEHDVRAGRRFADAACRCCWPIEYWHPTEGLQLEYLPPGSYYEIPLRALKVRGINNVWAAGKCLSADHKAQSSARVVGQCWAMGEAAGQAAARPLDRCR